METQKVSLINSLNLLMRLPCFNLLLPFTLFLILNLSIKQSLSAPPDFVPSCPINSLSELPEPPLSATEPSIPSLWLAEDFFGGEILNTWFVDSNDSWVILVVNQLIWRQKDYIAHYQFVNHFGTVARQYGYHLQVCENRQKQPIAAYICDFETAPLNCQVKIDSRLGRSLFSKPKIFPVKGTEKGNRD